MAIPTMVSSIILAPRVVRAAKKYFADLKESQISASLINSPAHK